MTPKLSRRGVLAGAAACAVVPTSHLMAAPAMHIVEIKKLKFVPETIEIRLGDTIKWVNKDIAPHTATALTKSWDSKRLKKNQSFELTVTKETETAYFCIYHPHMQGVIAVVD